MILTQLGLFAVGLGILLAGGQLLVRGAVALANSFGVSSLVIGLTIVSFGTSSPELAVCITSALKGNDNVAIANAVGSNIINVLLILGLSALLKPIPVAPRLARVITPLMILCSIALAAMAMNLNISRLEAAGLVVGLLGYVWLSYRMAHAGQDERHEQTERQQRRTLANVIICAAGLVLLVAGSNLMVGSAVSIAEALHVSQVVIGLTIVAIGTSLPELATTLIAVMRREPDLAAGNVVGSNIFNILAIVGITGLVKPLSLSNELLVRDIPVMLGVAFLLLFIFLTRKSVSRMEGAVLMIAYAAYTAWLIISSGTT